MPRLRIMLPCPFTDQIAREATSGAPPGRTLEPTIYADDAFAYLTMRDPGGALVIGRFAIKTEYQDKYSHEYIYLPEEALSGYSPEKLIQEAIENRAWD